MEPPAILVETESGEKKPIYGACTTRYWLGSRGHSLYYCNTAPLTQPIAPEDRENLLPQLIQAVTRDIYIKIAQETGLLISGEEIGEKLEWHIEWEATPDLLERARRYEECLDPSAPEHLRTRRQMTPEQKQLLAQLRRRATRAIDAQATQV
jgi:hypothetical protein